MQSLLDLLLGLLGKGAPNDRSTELAERLDGLVCGHLLDDHEQRRGPRLELPANLVDEVLVDTGLLDLEEPFEACADRCTKDRNEEHTGEEQTPEDPKYSDPDRNRKI